MIQPDFMFQERLAIIDLIFSWIRYIDEFSLIRTFLGNGERVWRYTSNINDIYGMATFRRPRLPCVPGSGKYEYTIKSSHNRSRFLCVTCGRIA